MWLVSLFPFFFKYIYKRKKHFSYLFQINPCACFIQHHLFVLRNTKLAATRQGSRGDTEGSFANHRVPMRLERKQNNPTKQDWHFFFFLHGWCSGMLRLIGSNLTKWNHHHRFSVTPPTSLSRGVLHCPSLEWRQRFPDFVIFIFCPFVFC